MECRIWNISKKLVILRNASFKEDAGKTARKILGPGATLPEDTETLPERRSRWKTYWVISKDESELGGFLKNLFENI